jgi:hypothetical protein
MSVIPPVCFQNSSIDTKKKYDVTPNAKIEMRGKDREKTFYARYLGTGAGVGGVRLTFFRVVDL